MNSRSTWTWLTIACALVIVLAAHLYLAKPETPELGRILPQLDPAQVASLHITPGGQREIVVVRTNGAWELTRPLPYPAQTVVIETLLDELSRMVPAAFIGPAELKDRPTADEDYGLKQPLASVVINTGARRHHLLLGARTAPGDQFFLQVVGVEGVHVVDAELLKLVPRTVNDIRETAFANLESFSPTRISVTNGTRFVELERDGPDGLWRMVRPLDARADSQKVEELLKQLQTLRVASFISDEPGTDLDGYGLQPADLGIALTTPGGPGVHLRFGKTPTNSPSHVFAQRVGLPSVVTVPKEQLAGWRGAVNDFRDPHLVTLRGDVDRIDIRAADAFSLERQTNGTWRVLPQGYAADAARVHDLLTALPTLRIIEFTKDVVTPIDLANYGLADPLRRYILLSSSKTQPGRTNRILAQVDFGTNVSDRVFARRSDENAVYAVSIRDFQRLPFTPLHLRERQIWDFSEDDIASVTIQHRGKTRQLIRKGKHDWTLAAGSQGIINELAIEESVKPICRLAALSWVAAGPENREKYGFVEGGYKLTLHLKNGNKLALELGSAAGPDSAFASVDVNGEPMIFEMPSAAYRFLATYLTIPDTTL